MDALWQMLDPRCVAMELKARRKEEALAEMVGLLVKSGRLREPETLLKAMKAREKQASTGIGEGIAIPHCVSPQLASTVLALGLKPKGLPFNAIDGQPVRLVFLLVGPEGQQTSHLRLLSRLARLLRDRALVEDLLAAKSPRQAVEVLRRSEQAER